jgi:hypothetical protein
MRRKARKLYLAMGMALVAMFVAAGAVFAAVTFDPATGTGFVGKGDVQTALGLNNAQLQAQAASLQFTAVSTSTTTWTCSKPHPSGDPNKEITNERSTETTTQGIVSSIARVKNQITGFNLSGYSGTPTVTTDGPAVDTCPAAASGFTFDEGSSQTTPGSTQLYVNGVLLPITPTV